MQDRKKERERERGREIIKTNFTTQELIKILMENSIQPHAHTHTKRVRPRQLVLILGGGVWLTF